MIWWQRLQGQAGPIYGLLIGGKMLGLTHCNISHPFIMYYFFSFLPQVLRKKGKTLSLSLLKEKEAKQTYKYRNVSRVHSFPP